MVCSNCQREIAGPANFCQFCGARQTASAGIPVTGIPTAKKRLTRSSSDSKIAGVCGGVAEYLDADPGIVRIVMVLCTVASGFAFGVLVYVVAWLVLPLDYTSRVQAGGVRAPSAPTTHAV